MSRLVQPSPQRNHPHVRGIHSTVHNEVRLTKTKVASPQSFDRPKTEGREAVRAFYVRWSRTAMVVRYLTPETASHHLMEATTNAELKRALAKRPVDSLLPSL
ncbi:unnamed protein product [Linum trigynum]|uniref:Uncharacterized protein n=1 Tax=Linum trigynum TaxID=586398 RepID=A0AAV2CAB5_9ROSI